MKTSSVLALCAVAVAAAGIGLAAGTPPARNPRLDSQNTAVPATGKLRTFMRGKLEASENVLEGLVTEDFKKIEKGAEKMIAMSKAAHWQVLETKTYAQYSAEFQRIAEQLAKMAKRKQLDSAALSYMQVTMTCINCHKYVKKEKVALGEPISPGLKFALRNDHRHAKPTVK